MTMIYDLVLVPSCYICSLRLLGHAEACVWRIGRKLVEA